MMGWIEAEPESRALDHGIPQVSATIRVWAKSVRELPLGPDNTMGDKYQVECGECHQGFEIDLLLRCAPILPEPECPHCHAINDLSRLARGRG